MCKLNKGVCKRCYQYHEKMWNDRNEDEWVNGEVHCPGEHFEMLQMRGSDLEIKDKRLRDIFGMIFGWIETKNGCPDWCEFKEHHKSCKIK